MRHTRRRSADGERVDARTERWREHRVKVRAEFVDAAFRALDRIGPDVSMDDVAKEAGAAKPKLYRHFEDKIDLYMAILERIQDLLWERILASVDVFSDTADELVRKALAEYALVVDEHPNVFRFLVHNHFTQQAEQSERAILAARAQASKAARLLDKAFSDSREMSSESVELIVYATFGAVGSATDWWLGVNRLEGGAAMSTDSFVGYLHAMVGAMLAGAARANGIALEPDQPLHLAFPVKQSS